jgi:signal transduction histidine kinase
MLSMPALGMWKAGCQFDQDGAFDLSELRRLATIGRMAQFISHDLRHHLSAVYSGAEFMSDANTPQTDREGLLKEVATAVRTMTDLLDSLLLFAQSGRALHPKPGSLSVVIERAVAMVRCHPDAENVEIGIREMSIVEGWMDCQRLGSAIYNLLLNGCQAAQRGSSPGKVEITLTQSQSLVHVRVTDSGPGVPHSIRKTLFEPFVRAGAGAGAGLRLTIAQCNAREHGGLVCLEESAARRTIFVLYLSKPALAALAPRASAQGKRA